MTDTNCQRASQSLYETIAVSLFAHLLPHTLLAASPLVRGLCSATFAPRIFEQRRDCSQSNVSLVCTRIGVVGAGNPTEFEILVKGKGGGG